MVTKLINAIHHINKLKGKKHDMTLDAEKAFDKIQQSFMTKVLERSGIQGTYLKYNKGNIQQANDQHPTKRNSK